MRAASIFLAIMVVTTIISCSNNQTEVENPKTYETLDTTLAEIRNSRYLEFDSNFAHFWNQFALLIKTDNQKEFKSKLLDSLVIYDTSISTQTFLSKCYSEVFNNNVKSALSDSHRIEYYTYLPLNLEEIAPFARNIIIQESNILKFREIEIIPRSDSEEKNRAVFSFIKTPKGYIFYRYYYVTKQGLKNCCG